MNFFHGCEAQNFIGQQKHEHAHENKLQVQGNNNYFHGLLTYHINKRDSSSVTLLVAFSLNLEIFFFIIFMSQN